MNKYIEIKRLASKSFLAPWNLAFEYYTLQARSDVLGQVFGGFGILLKILHHYKRHQIISKNLTKVDSNGMLKRPNTFFLNLPLSFQTT